MTVQFSNPAGVAAVMRSALMLLTPPESGFDRKAAAAAAAIDRIRDAQRQMLRAGVASRPGEGLFAQADKLIDAIEQERAIMAAWHAIGIDDDEFTTQPAKDTDQ